MGKIVLKNPVVTVNSVDLSNRFSQVTIASKFDAVDGTTFGGQYKEILQGLGDATMTFTATQDYAAGEVDVTLWPLSQSGATFPVTVKPTNAAVSVTNPLYSMTGILLEYNPIDGKVGDLLTTPVTIQNGSQAGLTRATT
jgi:hypothetical protein